MPVRLRYEVPSLSSSLSYVLHSSRCAYYVMLGRVIERLDCRSENQALCSKLDTNVLYDHYGDVIMGTMASQITSLTIVYSTVYSGADQRKHQSSASLAFVRGIHRGPVNSPHKWPVTRKIYPFDDVIMISSAICDCFLCTYLPLLSTLILTKWSIFCILQFQMHLKKVYILISLKFVPWGPIDNKSLLALLCLQKASSHYLKQYWPSSLTPYNVIRPQIHFTTSHTVAYHVNMRYE